MQQYERIVPTLEPIDVSLPLAERIDAFVGQRSRLLETVTPVRRAPCSEPESEVVSSWLPGRAQAEGPGARGVFRAELEQLGPSGARRAARRPRGGVRLDLLGGAAPHQRLSVDRSRAAMAATLTALLAGQR